MKFAKELEQELVPEWRIKYLNYKAGKKYIKAVSRAINRANSTPILRRSGDIFPRQTPNLFSAGSPFSPRRRASNNGGAAGGRLVAPGEERQSLRSSPAALGQSPEIPGARKPEQQKRSQDADGERRSLNAVAEDRPHYGSIMNPSRARSPSEVTDGSHTFELPAPAMRVPSNISEPPARPPIVGQSSEPAKASGALRSAVPWIRPSAQRSYSLAVPAYRQAHGGTGRFDQSSRPPGMPSPHDLTPRQRIRRLFSVATPQQWTMAGGSASPAGGSRDDIDMRALDEVRERELDFFRFLDSELDKVETFYKQKEEQAGKRLALLREQLHVMRNRRIEEIQLAKRRGEENATISPGGSGDEDGGEASRTGGAANRGSSQPSELDHEGKSWDVHQEWIAPLKAKIFKPGPNSKALQKMPQTPRMLDTIGGLIGGGAAGVVGEGRRDYIRRPGDHDIPYRTAKRKLKLALQEFYRGLELLKSYALLNRTAFRKLNKKYDKAVNARPPYRYMNEKVNRSWFVNSTVVDDLIVNVEDLYARYFERGNHKIAASKLRQLVKRPGDESGSAFRNGIMIGVGAVFAIQGTVDGSKKLFDPDPLLQVQTSYLMQLYGGYFLMLYLFTLFCLDCRVWTINKVNYPFIFEFDPRSHLDWRQLSQFPSFFFLVFGLFMWLNFSDAANPRLFLYYPVILIGFTVVLLFFPAPTLWHRSRKWFLYSHWRLFFAGLYPVEFRDFFLGDMYCSLIYSTCNIELFFCLYANAWGDPAQCNSSHSRLLGFFSTLPPIWRLLQCLRRYRDTRNIFPHLVNGGKYTMTILSYMTLSLYRIKESHGNLALFITFSVLNSVYSSFWDLFMDFSLLQVESRHFLLRDILSYKRRWIYYAIMVIDPILRFTWIFYAIFTHDAQHNSICSFMVGFGEVTRRGIWALLRVENEHCANVAMYKASRDIPLPYDLHEAEWAEQTQPFLSGGDDTASVSEATEGGEAPGTGHATGVDGTPSVAAGGGPGAAFTPTISTPGRTATAASVSSHRKHRHHHMAGTPGSGAGKRPDIEEGGGVGAAEAGATAASSTGTEAVSGVSPSLQASAGLMRRRRTSTLGKSIGIMMAEAHKQDFEKKRKPGLGDSPLGRPGAVDELGSSDEDDNGDGVDDDEDSGDIEDDYEYGLAENGRNNGDSQGAEVLQPRPTAGRHRGNGTGSGTGSGSGSALGRVPTRPR